MLAKVVSGGQADSEAISPKGRALTSIQLAGLLAIAYRLMHPVRVVEYLNTPGIYGTCSDWAEIYPSLPKGTDNAARPVH
jgi:hypothetical protein